MIKKVFFIKHAPAFSFSRCFQISKHPRQIPQAFGLIRREAKRHAAFVRNEIIFGPETALRPKAVSPLRSATALHEPF
jgi:hypothetical protein